MHLKYLTFSTVFENDKIIIVKKTRSIANQMLAVLSTLAHISYCPPCRRRNEHKEKSNFPAVNWKVCQAAM